jgi:hypothetical protein
MAGKKSKLRGASVREPRRRTGCLTCRSRDVKCDEERPTCYRCRAANYYCDGYEEPRRASNSLSRVVQQDIHTPLALPPETPYRRLNWRQEQLPFYHHFVTTTAMRLFREAHIGFWRDYVAQISFGVDIVYEAIVAIGALHRASYLERSGSENGQEVARCKVLGLLAYGRVLKSLASEVLLDDSPDPRAVLIALLLCSYFEVSFFLTLKLKRLIYDLQCVAGNYKAAFRHLAAALQVLDISKRACEVRHWDILPIYEITRRLDLLAKNLVPCEDSSHLSTSNLALIEVPYWHTHPPQQGNWEPVEISRLWLSESSSLSQEVSRLTKIICSYGKLSRAILGHWESERTSREELVAFYNDLVAWKATSPVTFANYPSLGDPHTNCSTLPPIPQPLGITSRGAALNILQCNVYLSCVLSIIAATDEDPIGRESKAFNLEYQNLRITAPFKEPANESGQQSSDPRSSASNVGNSYFWFHGARRCFSRDWQLWTIAALRDIGRKGHPNGHASGNTLELMCQLEDASPYKPSIEGSDTRQSPLGPIRNRIIPVLMPRGVDGHFMAYFLRYGETKSGKRAVCVIERATWTQPDSGDMQDLELLTYEWADARAISGSFNPAFGGGEEERSFWVCSGLC